MKNIYNRIYRLLRDTKITHVLAREGDNVYLSTPVIDDKFLGEFVHDTQLRTKLLDITALAHKNGNCICRYPNVSLPFADARLKDWVEQYEELGKTRRKAS